MLNGWELALGLAAFAAVGWAVTRPEPEETALVLAPALIQRLREQE